MRSEGICHTLHLKMRNNYTNTWKSHERLKCANGHKILSKPLPILTKSQLFYTVIFIYIFIINITVRVLFVFNFKFFRNHVPKFYQGWKSGGVASGWQVDDDIGGYTSELIGKSKLWPQDSVWTDLCNLVIYRITSWVYSDILPSFWTFFQNTLIQLSDQ